MGRKQTPETRAKISQGVKNTIRQKRIAADPVQSRARRLTDAFDQGAAVSRPVSTPTHFTSTGGLAQEHTPLQARLERQLGQEKVQRAAETAESYGLTRGPQLKEKREGERFKPQMAGAQHKKSDRQKLSEEKQRRMEKLRGLQ